MTLIVEDGTGIFAANGYVGRGYVRQYLQSRNRVAEWDAATDAQRDAGIIAATDYVDRRFGPRLRGFKEFTELTVAAWNILQIRTNPTENDTVTIDTTVYTFVAAAAVAYEVTIGADVTATAQSLVDAINGVGATPAHPDVSAAATDSPGDVIVRALVAGALVTAIPVSTSTVSMVWDTDSLSGGYDTVEQFLEFPRIHLYTPSGGVMSGIPERLRQAVGEYASRAIAEILMPDPASSSQSGELIKFSKTIGPISISKEFSAGTFDEIFKKYPTADRLMTEFLRAPGQVYR